MGHKDTNSESMDKEEVIFGYALTKEEFSALKEAISRVTAEDVCGGEKVDLITYIGKILNCAEPIKEDTLEHDSFRGRISPEDVLLQELAQ